MISSFKLQDSDKVQLETEMHLLTSEADTPNINRIPSSTNSMKMTFLESFKEKFDNKHETIKTKIFMKPLSDMKVSGNSKNNSP